MENTRKEENKLLYSSVPWSITNKRHTNDKISNGEHYLYIEKALFQNISFDEIRGELYKTMGNAYSKHYGTLCGIAMPLYMSYLLGFTKDDKHRSLVTPYGTCPITTVSSPSDTLPDKVFIKIKVSSMEFKLLLHYLQDEYPQPVPVDEKTVLASTKDIKVGINVFNDVPNLTYYYHLL